MLGCCECVKWKVLCKNCTSERPGINVDLGPGIKVKIIPKENTVKCQKQCLTWKLISRSRLSQRLGMNVNMVLCS
ncbi:X antigen family member 1 [Plecturocebus cupreus]